MVLRPWNVRPALQLLVIGSVALLGATGCNSLTGASDLTVGGVGSLDGTGDGQGGGSASGSGTTSAATQCTWPETGFGVKKGQFVRPNLTWQGYREGEDMVSDIAMDEFFDCDGSRGINGLLVIQSAEWCGNCQAEAQDVGNLATSKWADLGIKVLTLMIEDTNAKPATTDLAQKWRDQFHLDATDVVADPQFSFAYPGTIGLPLQLIIDPRTMQIVDTQEGYSGTHPSLENLANQNAAQ